MKKNLVIIGAITLILALLPYESKFYYPSLPFEGGNKKEVLELISKTSEDVVKIAEEDNYEWYVTRMEQGKEYENLKNMLNGYGWEFEKRVSTDYFFKKKDKRLIANTRMWTKKFIMIKIPKFVIKKIPMNWKE